MASVAGVVWWALGQEPPELPATTGEFAALGAAVLLYFAACAVRAERWLVLLRRNGGRPLRRDMYGLTAVGYMGNNVLPARAGDALRVVFLHPRVDTDRRTVIGTLLAERLLDVAVLGTLFVVLAFGALQGIEVPAGGRVALGLGLVALAVVGGTVAWWVLRRSGRAERLRTFVAPMLTALTRLRGRHLVEVVAISLVVWCLETVAWWATGRASGLDVSLLEAGFILALTSMVVLIPSGPGYAGTLDAAIILATQALGRSASAGVSFLLLLRFVIMVPITAAGLIALLMRYGGRRGLAAARA
ncbi:MAG TPA: lysylphosphatidylglycerol synthase transmembrane domain-containing protein [Solirubrobacteraceae bacterium]|nr:lysylphosphatidylglycerol synthase transmembrane domain-containing protein [Solirubrobacteraceae bacterium]